MLKEIEKAVEALKAVPAEFRDLVVSEAAGTGKRRGPKPGAKKGKKAKVKGGYTKTGAKRKKPGPKPGFKKAQVKAVVKKAAVKRESPAPVKVASSKAAKVEKLRKLAAAADEEVSE